MSEQHHGNDIASSKKVKMKIFQLIQKNQAIVGICPNQTQTFNKSAMVTLFLYVLGFTSSALYLFNEARTFVEYTYNMNITTCLAMIMIIYTIVICKMSKLFEYIAELEKLVCQSR